MQTLAIERAEESSRLAVAQRDLLGAGDGLLSAEDLADLTVRKAQIADLARQLRDLEATAGEGGRLLADASVARQALVLARRRDEFSVSILPDVEATIQATLGQPSSNYADIDEALARLCG